jgi:hypothetical protein
MDLTSYNTMRPQYLLHLEQKYAEIKYNDYLTYIVDIDIHIELLNSKKNFKINAIEDRGKDGEIIYPSYTSNGKEYTLINFIYKFPPETTTYIFENNNQYDLRRENVKIYHNYYNIMKEKYEVQEYIQGHYNNFGIDAFIMKNPIWVIKENEKEYLFMFCESNTICKLCRESYQKILDYEKQIGEKLTWFKHQKGYIYTQIPKINTGLFIHQVITGCYGNGRGTSTISVDHIDRDKLNNTMENLRLATREEQQKNTKGCLPNTKRERQSNARPLPEGITQDMLKKYVVYYYNVYDKKNNKSREYFRVEGHPKLKKFWETTKSGEVSILEKLQQANKVIDDLELDIFPKNFTEQRELPKHVSIVNSRNVFNLTFDKRIEDGKRMNLKMVIPDNYNLDVELENLRDKIRTKYNISDFML